MGGTTHPPSNFIVPNQPSNQRQPLGPTNPMIALRALSRHKLTLYQPYDKCRLGVSRGGGCGCRGIERQGREGSRVIVAISDFEMGAKKEGTAVS